MSTSMVLDAMADASGSKLFSDGSLVFSRCHGVVIRPAEIHLALQPGDERVGRVGPVSH